MSGTGETKAPESAVREFASKQGELLSRVRGKWALFHETNVVDFFETREEALAAGYEKLRDVPFVVRQVPDSII